MPPGLAEAAGDVVLRPLVLRIGEDTVGFTGLHQDAEVEEGRHLWAMVYLLQKYFGRDGREEANDLLVRSSGSDEAPRMLGAFNEETPDWLSPHRHSAVAKG